MVADQAPKRVTDDGVADWFFQCHPDEQIDVCHVGVGALQSPDVLRTLNSIRRALKRTHISYLFGNFRSQLTKPLHDRFIGAQTSKNDIAWYPVFPATLNVDGDQVETFLPVSEQLIAQLYDYIAVHFQGLLGCRSDDHAVENLSVSQDISIVENFTQDEVAEITTLNSGTSNRSWFGGPDQTLEGILNDAINQGVPYSKSCGRKLVGNPTVDRLVVLGREAHGRGQ